MIDTGPIVAILSAADQHHERCVAELAGLRPPLLTCWPVITEAQWLLRHDAKAVQALFQAFSTGLLALLPVDATAMPSMASFFLRYSKRRPDLADGMLVHLAEREDIATIFTLDQRDFSIYRFGKNRHFKILPAAH
jgi:predicted nucleic acid-binding protein